MCAERNEGVNDSIVSMLIILLKSTVLALLLLVIMTLILSIVSMIFTLSAESVAIAQMVMMSVSVLIGGIYAGAKRRRQGWLVGGLTGLFFAAIMLAFAGRYSDISLAMANILRQFGIGFLIGALGGSIGVNIPGLP